MSPVTWLYALPLFIILFLYLRKQQKNTRLSKTVYEEAVATGMTEPASIHPVVNHARCLGCSSCVTACPERDKNVMGIIHGKQQTRFVGGKSLHLPATNHRRSRPAPESIEDKVMAIVFIAFDGEENIARLDLAAVYGKAGKLRRH